MIADSLPRFRTMRNYLAATGLLSGFSEDPDRESYSPDPIHAKTPRAAAMAQTTQAICARSIHAVPIRALPTRPDTTRGRTTRATTAQVTSKPNARFDSRAEPGVRSNASRNLAAIEDRFQTFKANYVQRYRSSHDRHCSELERIAPVADDARRQLEALRRLNAIAALGAPAGSELGPAMATLERRLAPCDFTEALSPEVTPCCPRCGFLLGTPSPDKELSDLADRVRRALQAKLAALSHNAVARLIREHDRNHRLEGFLKIVQAAQTDSLVRILDDELARYLAQLLSENSADSLAADGTAADATADGIATNVIPHGNAAAVPTTPAHANPADFNRRRHRDR